MRFRHRNRGAQCSGSRVAKSDPSHRPQCNLADLEAIRANWRAPPTADFGSQLSKGHRARLAAARRAISRSRAWPFRCRLSYGWSSDRLRLGPRKCSHPAHAGVRAFERTTSYEDRAVGGSGSFKASLPYFAFSRAIVPFRDSCQQTRGNPRGLASAGSSARQGGFMQDIDVERAAPVLDERPGNRTGFDLIKPRWCYPGLSKYCEAFEFQ